jgi:hypothetical protein
MRLVTDNINYLLPHLISLNATTTPTVSDPKSSRATGSENDNNKGC